MHRNKLSRVSMQLGDGGYQYKLATPDLGSIQVSQAFNSPFPNCWRPALPHMGWTQQLLKLRGEGSCHFFLLPSDSSV